MWQLYAAAYYRTHETAGVPGSTVIAGNTVERARFWRVAVAAGAGARTVTVYLSSDGELWHTLDTQTLNVDAVGVSAGGGSPAITSTLTVLAERRA